MNDKNYRSEECYYDKIMDLFLEYVVLFMIYYKTGGKISDLDLGAEMGYVRLKKNSYERTKGFKFLENYCTTLNFSTEAFSHVVSNLRMEFKEIERKERAQKVGLGKAYGNLTNWWELEDEQVTCYINDLRNEIRTDKYPITSYHGIIGQLMILESYGYVVGNIDEIIDYMNQNIQNSDEKIEKVDRYSYSFDDKDMRIRYSEYLDKIKWSVDSVNNNIQSSEITDILNHETWEDEILEYCKEHYNDFILRYGFIDLINIEIFISKLQRAKVQEWYTATLMLKSVYKVSNITDFFSRDREKLEKILDEIQRIEVSGINKPLAQKNLVEYIKDILDRLK